MAYLSGLRGSRGGLSKGAATLRPPQIFVWGIRNPSRDLANSVSALEKLAANRDERLNNSRKQELRKTVVPSPESSIDPHKKTVVKSARKNTTPLNGNAQFTAQMSTLDPPLASLAREPGAVTQSSATAEPSLPEASIPALIASRIPASDPSLKLANSDHLRPYALKPLAEQSQMAREVIEATQSLREGPNDPLGSQLKGSLNDGTSQSPATIAHVRPQTLSIPSSHHRQVAEAQATTDQEVLKHRAWSQVMNGVESGTPAGGQTARTGNAIHIGTVDIHIHSSVKPVVRQRARHPAPSAPITRGFAASFGLNQA
jgi:hypothetical protein